MTYMEQIAKILDVEIGEEFKIEGHSDNVKYRLTEENLEYFYDGKWYTISITLHKLLNGEYKVVKLPKPILTEEEKEYLSYVIRPFRNDVKCIVKYSVDYVEWITICMKTCHDMDFPIFDIGTMYKGIEIEKEYTLEELEL